ncbi:MAG: thioredoxin-dependent thiol peroxidase [Sphingobacteriales bacterium]|nr:thioredoxin-dependent thiol peroxidase [Sphingobacteriales bacterium]
MSVLQTGDIAPVFSGKDQNGNTVALENLSGKKVILYFYPKDDTPGCTAQACNLRDNYAALQAAGYVLLGISPDNEKKHQKFISKYDLPFPLLADTDHSIAEAYGVWGKKKFMGREYMGILRTTFIIDEQGKIERIISNVNTAEHTAQILE